jgi:hypothetical protein
MLLEQLIFEKKNQNQKVGMLSARENELTRSIIDKMRLIEDTLKSENNQKSVKTTRAGSSFGE